MSDKVLTRYKLLDDVRGEVIGVTPRLVHDFCEGYEMVDADAAQREIAKRDILIRNLRNALVSLEKEARQMCESSYGDDDD